MRLNFRLLSLLGFLGCAFGLAFAIVYLQHMRGYEPCPFCIFQRIAMAATGIVFLVGALHGPRAGGRWFYALLAMLTAAIGIGIADRKSVVSGKSESVRVDPGGRRTITKNTHCSTKKKGYTAYT